MIRKCETCGSDMELKTVQKKNAKNFGELIAIHKYKRFCSKNCQLEWQKNCNWEDRVGKVAADRIREEASIRVSGENNPTHNPDIAKKVSDSLKVYLKENPRNGDKNPFYDREHSEEYVKWASESRKGKWSYNNEQYIKKVENQPRGENCHLWKGGISFEPYSLDFNKQLKNKIKERDKYTCICGKETQKLAIHHIDYDKMNSDEKNLISLCYNCHSKTNSNREHWKIFFIGIINEKYVILTDN